MDSLPEYYQDNEGSDVEDIEQTKIVRLKRKKNSHGGASGRNVKASKRTREDSAISA